MPISCSTRSTPSFGPYPLANDTVIKAALAHWDLSGADVSLIAARENRVYRVDHKSAQFALRLHRPGYRSDMEIKSELEWLRAVAKGGLSVPAPCLAPDGSLLFKADGVTASITTWLPGTPMGQAGKPLTLPHPKQMLRRLGP